MPLGSSTRAISSPIGTAGAAAPYGMATAGTATRRVQGSKFVPLSVFFLQLSGEEEEEGDGKQVKGYAEKGVKNDEKLGTMHFGGTEKSQTRATKGPRPKAKKRKPLELGGDEEVQEERGGTAHFTGTASKPQPCKYCGSKATRSLIWAEGRAYIPVCDEHESKARAQIVDVNEDEITYVRKIDEDTTTANVAAYPVPIGAPLRRVAPAITTPAKRKKRKQWMERLAQSMGE